MREAGEDRKVFYTASLRVTPAGVDLFYVRVSTVSDSSTAAAAAGETETVLSPNGPLGTP